MALIDNLVSYYKLDGNSNDAHGSNNGTVNGATYTASGKINGAYDFDGSNDYINLNDTISKLFEGTKNYTFSCWAKFDDLNGNRFLLSSISSTSAGYKYRNCIIFIESNKSVRCIRYNGSDSDDVSTASGIISTGIYYHIVVTYDGSLLKIYVNNVEEASISATLNASNGGDANLGSLIELGSRSSYLNGIMDEVGIWSRALSSTEVGELYNSGAGLAYPFTSDTSNPLLAFNF
jgi:hypothetical protein